LDKKVNEVIFLEGDEELLIRTRPYYYTLS